MKGKEREAGVLAHLNPVVIRIGNNHTIRIRYGYIMRMLKLSLATAAGTEFANEGTIGLENLTNANIRYKFAN